MGYDIEKEKREAIEAGRRALNSLRTAKENLNSAKNWGLVDMFGGGFFTTLLKHSKMDQAKRNMETCCHRFSKKDSPLPTSTHLMLMRSPVPEEPYTLI